MINLLFMVLICFLFYLLLISRTKPVPIKTKPFKPTEFPDSSWFHSPEEREKVQPRKLPKYQTGNLKLRRGRGSGR